MAEAKKDDKKDAKADEKSDAKTGDKRNGESKDTGSDGSWWQKLGLFGGKDGIGDPDKFYEKLKKKSDKTKVSYAKGAGVTSSTNIGSIAEKKDAMYKTNMRTIAQIATPAALFGVGGMAAPFLNNTDPPGALNNQGLGSFYLENNITHGQFVVFKPGYVSWGITSSDAENLITKGTEILGGMIGKLFSGKLVDLNPSLDDYWFDVERSMRIAIYELGLNDAWFPFQMGGEGVSKAKKWGDRLGNQGGGSMELSYCKFGNMTRKNWRNLGLRFANEIANKTYGIPQGASSTNNKSGKNEIQDVGLVAFYVNGNVEISESISNQQADNPLREMLSRIAGDGDESVKRIIGMVGWGGKTVDQSALGFMTGQPLIPQSWSGTTVDKSYSFSVRCAIPSGDPVSFLMGIMYPGIKMLHLTLPLGIGGYQTSPSIVSVFSLGTMNIKYGLITSLTMQKNLQTLSDNGLPTELDMQVSVVDLNPHLYKERPGWFRTSIEIGTGVSNWIANMIGLNVSVVPNSTLKAFQNELRKIDENFNGRVLLENGVFAVQNFISRFARDWTNGGYEVGGRAYSVTEKVKGLFGFGKNYVPKKTLSGVINSNDANPLLSEAPQSSKNTSSNGRRLTIPNNLGRVLK